MDNRNSRIITRLTALWAVSESGLGGFMHALKIPFTGFFLGGFAIVIITLIGFYSEKKWRSILLATLLVMLVKAIGSPHSPPQAYLAVGFQGLIGAFVYALFGISRVSGALFGMIALAESAMQKVIFMTLIFGKSIWKALDAFGQGIKEDFGLNGDLSLSWWLIIIYTGLYIVWGFIVGFWSIGLPRSLDKRSGSVLQELVNKKIDPSGNNDAPKKKNKSKYLFLILTLVFIAIVFLWQGSVNKVVYVVLRTFAALLLLYFIINPLLKWIMARWLEKQGEEKQSQVRDVMSAMPEIRSYINPAMQIARKQHKGLAVYPAFVMNWIVLSLYHE